MSTLPFTPETLAADPRLLNGAWRDTNGLDLFDTLANEHGQATTEAAWRAAVDLIEQTYGPPGQATFPPRKATAT